MDMRVSARRASSANGLRSETYTALVLLAADVVAWGVALALTTVAFAVFDGSLKALAGCRELWLLPLVFVGYGLSGVYPGPGIGPVEEMRRLILVSTVFSWSVVAFMLVSPLSTGSGHVAFVSVWVFALVMVPLMRAVARQVFAHRTWWGTPAVVIGNGQLADGVTSRLSENPGLGLKLVARLDPGRIASAIDDSPTYPAFVCAEVRRLRRERGVNYAIIAVPDLRPDRLDGIVRELGTLVANIVVIPTAFGRTSVGIGTRDSGGVVGLYIRGHASLRWNRIVKRGLDLVLSAFIVPPALVVLLFASLAVMVVSPGNPFYRQVREGFGGRPIRIWKLRTMRRDADAYLERYLQSNPKARAEWEMFFKLRHDPRVLPFVGRFLRRTSLDELPQIFNVLAGSLSFVGPRPFPAYHLDRFDGSFRALRSSMVPGLTGWWQVMSRSTADLVQQVELDSFYIHNWSLWLDLYILARTPWAVIRGSGAH